MAGNDGSVVLGTELDTSGLKKGLGGIGGIASKGLKAVGFAVAAVGAGLVAAGKYAVDVGSSFDSAMSQVAATMGTTVDQIGGLSDAAKEMGATTQFTATEAAEALNYLALAGYDAEKQIAALPTVLNLAAAGDMDLAYASDLVTDSMAALGLETIELEGYADKLAKTAQTSNTSVSQLGEAVLVCGGQAKLAGMSVTDMNTALGILADNGIKGSEGGTALRNVLKNLYTPTSAAQKAMKALGIETANADGTLRDTQSVLQDLSAAMDGLTEADRMTAMADIFDTRTIAAANALLKDSGARWDELSDKIDNASGAAENMAATMLDNLEGDITLFKSALEGLGIAAYESLRGPLREIVQFGTGIIGQLNEAVSEGGLEGLVGAIGDILAQVVQRVAEFAPQLLTAASSLIQSFIAGISENMDSVAGAITETATAFVQAIIDIVPLLIETGIQLIVALMDGIGQQLPTLIPAIVQGVLDVVNAIIENIPAFLEAAIALVGGLVQGIMDALPLLIEAVPILTDALCTTLIENTATLVEVGVEFFTALIGNLPAIIQGIVAIIPQLVDAIVDSVISTTSAIVDAGVTLLVALIENLPAIIQGIVAAIPSIISGIVKTLAELTPVLIDAGVQLFISLVQNLPAIILEIVKAIPAIIQGIIQGFAGFGAKIAECGQNLLSGLFGKKDRDAETASLVADVGASADEAASRLDTAADSITFPEKVSTKLSEAGESVKEFAGDAGEWLKELPGNMADALESGATAVTDWGKGIYKQGKTALSDLATGAGEWLKALPDNIAYALGYALGSVLKFGQDLYTWATTVIPQAVDAVVQFFAELPGKIADWLTVAIDNVLAWGEALITKAVEIGTAFVEDIVSFVSTLPERVSKWLTDTANNVTKWAANMLQKAIQAGRDFVNNIVNQVKTLPANIWNWLQQAFTKVTTWCGNLISTATTKMREFATRIVDGIRDLPSRFAEIGSNIVSGIWNGISSGWTWLTSRVKSLAQSLLKGAKAALGIRSPSKPFREQIGKVLPKSIAIGFEEEMPKAYRRIKAAIDSEQQELNAHARAFARGGGDGGTEQVVFNGNVNVHANKLSDKTDWRYVSREMGAAVSRKSRYRGIVQPI